MQSGLHHKCNHKRSSNSGSNKRTQWGRTMVRPILEKYCVALMRCDRSAISLRVFCPKGRVGATPKHENQLPLETGYWGTLLSALNLPIRAQGLSKWLNRQFAINCAYVKHTLFSNKNDHRSRTLRAIPDGKLFLIDGF